MTAPQVYGYAHRGSITGESELDGYWFVRCSAINPARPVGPYAATVPGLTVGDRVLLTQIGTTRDDLVITGKLPPDPLDSILPIDIGDVTGLQTALDDKAAAADLTALQGDLASFQASTSLNFGAVTGKNDEQDGRLTAVETDNGDQWDQMAAFSGSLAALDGRLDTVEPTVSSHTTELAALQTWMNQAYDWDNYGDLLSPLHRREATNFMTLAVGSAYFTKMRAHTDVSVGRIRYALNNTGAGPGSITGGLYTASTSGGPFNLIKSTVATAATAINLYSVAWSDASTVAIPRGTWVMAALFCATGYTQSPRLATQQNAAGATQLLHPNPAAVVVGSKSGLAGLPATISPNDGTWTPLNLNFWAALAG